MYQINWTQPVLNALLLLRGHTNQYLPKFSSEFIQRLVDATTMLQNTPERGRLVFETDYQRAIRELLVNDFRIIYRINNDKVDTLAVMHARKHLIGLGSIRSRIRPTLASE